MSIPASTSPQAQTPANIAAAAERPETAQGHAAPVKKKPAAPANAAQAEMAAMQNKLLEGVQKASKNQGPEDVKPSENVAAS